MSLSTRLIGGCGLSSYEYNVTSLKVGVYNLEYKYTNKSVDIVEASVNRCKRLRSIDGDSLNRIRMVESCYMAKLEDSSVRIVEALTDKNEKQSAYFAASAFDGFVYLDNKTIDSIDKLTELWKTICKACYNDINTTLLDIRDGEIDSGILINSGMSTPVQALLIRIDEMLKINCKSSILTAIVKFIYLSLIEPFVRGNQRLALLILENDIGVKGLPLARILYEQFSTYKDIFKEIEFTGSNSIDITLLISLLLNSVSLACASYVNWRQNITDKEYDVIPISELYGSIKLSSIEEKCIEMNKDAYELIDSAKSSCLFIEEPNGIIVKIADF